MKPIELKLKMYSRTWLTPVLIVFTIFFAMAMVSPVNAAPPTPCDTFCDQDGDDWIRDHNKCLACDGPGVDCDDNDPLLTDDCSGGGGGDYIQHFKSVRVIWGDDVENFDELGLPYETGTLGNQKMRLCAPRLDEEPDPIIPIHPMVDIKNVCHGNAEFLYGREPGYWNTVYLDFSALTLEPGGRDLLLCERLVAATEDYPYFPMEIVPKAEAACGPPDRYCEEGDPANVGRLSGYHFVLDESNTEPCAWTTSNLDNACKVRIATQGYFFRECNETETKCGRRIAMEAYGRAVPAGEGVHPIEINPFNRYEQNIVLEEVNVIFYGIGNNRTEANCYFNNVNEEGGFHYDSLVLRTCVDNDYDEVCDPPE